MPSPGEGEGEGDDEGPFTGGELSSVIPQLAITSAKTSMTKARAVIRRRDVTAGVLVLGWIARRATARQQRRQDTLRSEHPPRASRSIGWPHGRLNR
jgi:hypothetical protein